MTLYQLLVFLHVLGGVGIFVALGIESISLSRLQSAAAPVDARVWMGLLKMPGRLGPIAMLTTLVTGMWMMAQAWGRQPWMVSAFVGLVGMAALGGVISLRGARRLRVALAGETGPELTIGFRSIRSGTALTASLRLRIAIGIGILGLMTTKPGAAGSLFIMAAAALSGLVSSIPFKALRSRLTGQARENVARGARNGAWRYL
jgi:hypothetical protein